MEKKISIIIPNYNGSSLLEKNLPQVIKCCPNAQIIVVDDASTDDSTTLLKSKFKLITLLSLNKNRGFAWAANYGVQEAANDIVLLLNTDVTPRHNFLKNVLPYFINENVFAVALADYSHESGSIIVRGRGGANFKKGFLNHFELKIEKAETLWVSGGSGVYDRKKFLELGGFDTTFAPFYWEDIDLSYRAQKSGFVCHFEPSAKVDHYHAEGAIKKNKSEFLIKTSSYKNQFIFVWKNISDYSMLIAHILWLPIHMVKELIKLDVPFFIGLLWAITKIPSLILNASYNNQKFTDKEVLSKFEK